MKNKIIYLLGAALFLAAQVILPGGAADAEERLQIILQNKGAWVAGHAMIFLSFPLLMAGFARLHEMARLLSPGQALFGLLFTLFGLTADAGIAGQQLFVSGMAESLSGEAVMQALAAGSAAQAVLTVVYLPYLLLLPGALLLALPLFRVNGYRLLSIALLVFGALAVAGGLMQAKWVFVIAGVALAVAFWQIPGEKQGLASLI